MNAWAIVASVCPAFSVPGISFTGTTLRSLNTAVVVANDPMPSVSSPAVKNPTISWSGVGVVQPPRTMVISHVARPRARPKNNRLLASIHQLVCVGFAQIDRGAAYFRHRSVEKRPHRRSTVRRHQPVEGKHRHRILQRLDIQGVVFA